MWTCLRWALLFVIFNLFHKKNSNTTLIQYHHAKHCDTMFYVYVKEARLPLRYFLQRDAMSITLHYFHWRVNERWWTWKWSEPHMDKIHIWVTARTSDSEPAGLTIIQVDNSGDFNRLGCFFTEERKLYFSDNWLWPLLKDTVVLRLSGNQLLFSWNQSLGSFW